MNNKPIYKKWWFWAIIAVIIIVATINLICAWKSNSANNANFYTAISGWISGIATAILGIIAIRVSKNLSKQQNAVGLLDKRFNAVLELKKLLKSYKISNFIVGLYEVQKKDINFLTSGITFRDYYISLLPRNEKAVPFGVFDIFEEYVFSLTLATKIFDENIKVDLSSFIGEFEKLHQAIFNSLSEKDSANLEKAINDYNNASKDVEKVLAKMELIIEESYKRGLN